MVKLKLVFDRKFSAVRYRYQFEIKILKDLFYPDLNEYFSIKNNKKAKNSFDSIINRMINDKHCANYYSFYDIILTNDEQKESTIGINKIPSSNETISSISYTLLIKNPIVGDKLLLDSLNNIIADTVDLPIKIESRDGEFINTLISNNYKLSSIHIDEF